jgi:CheY-like chemotaxis protein
MKILVIDDERLVRKSMTRAVVAMGHDAFEAENGLEGIKQWRQKKPDLVFLDVLMPGLSGPQVLKEMADKLGAKVILISAYTGEYDLEKAKELGADLFIPKPFEDIFKVIKLAEGVISE